MDAGAAFLSALDFVQEPKKTTYILGKSQKKRKEEGITVQDWSMKIYSTYLLPVRSREGASPSHRMDKWGRRQPPQVSSPTDMSPPGALSPREAIAT
jgi:hypothetical protein